MRGEITSYDEISNTGSIKGQDGQPYLFARHDIHTGSEIKVGQAVDFVPTGSTATQIVILGDAVAASVDPAAAFGTAAGAGTASAAPIGSGYDWQYALLKFDGRLRRQDFWISFLIILGASIVGGIIPIINLFIGLILIWPSVAIMSKRLHDMGKSGWLAVVPYAGWFVGLIVMFVGGAGAFMAAAATGDAGAAAAAGGIGAIGLGILIMMITSLGFLIWIGVTDSQPGTNQYGPNPKGL
ncbi:MULTISPECIES: DUF805 domain-containing protein [unclassified Brevundimonas]|uniref:DUF805 domain-containing protein n=1 Tax=unclassified Brevundimonas TaxID=2622653 RepID=UPI0025C2F90C|nr:MULTISPECIES: DUF805 domain-containing protein [unclassified Brevundimonas]